jgi:hypothetical protein
MLHTLRGGAAESQHAQLMALILKFTQVKLSPWWESLAAEKQHLREQSLGCRKHRKAQSLLAESYCQQVLVARKHFVGVPRLCFRIQLRV